MGARLRDGVGGACCNFPRPGTARCYICVKARKVFVPFARLNGAKSYEAYARKGIVLKEGKKRK